MGQPKLKLITIGAMSIIFLLFAGLALVFWGHKTPTRKVLEKSVDNGCLSSPVDFKMNDNSMEGVLNAGKTYPTFSNWQNCVHLQRGDVVLYKYSSGGSPVARKIAAIPGDTIELVRNPEKNNWQIKVNGSLYESDGAPYYFGSSADHPISLYEKAHKGLLDSKSFLIFANKPPGGRDSGEFGVISINDIVSIVANYANDGRN